MVVYVYIVVYIYLNLAVDVASYMAVFTDDIASDRLVASGIRTQDKPSLKFGQRASYDRDSWWTKY